MTVALVTGADKGIGREIVAQLAALGLTVLLGARDPRRREEAAAALREAGGDVHPVALDVTDPDPVRAAAASVDERFGRLDVLVNARDARHGRTHGWLLQRRRPVPC
ncbi:MAG: hypothetical protein V7603_3900 [Micromonosporaceae bacterium]